MGEEDFPLLMLKLTVGGLCFFVLQLFLPGLPAYALAAGIVGVLAGYLAGSPWRGVTSALSATAIGTILILFLNYRMFVGPLEGQLEELSFWASFAEAFVIAGMVAALTGAAAGAIAERQGEVKKHVVAGTVGQTVLKYGIAPIGTVFREEPVATRADATRGSTPVGSSDEKVACSKCGKLILKRMAALNDGQCTACTAATVFDVKSHPSSELPAEDVPPTAGAASLAPQHPRVFARLRAILADQLGIEPEEVKMESTFESLNADSLDIVELVMAIEQEWDMEVPDEAAEAIKTVGDAVNYIVAHA